MTSYVQPCAQPAGATEAATPRRRQQPALRRFRIARARANTQGDSRSASAPTLGVTAPVINGPVPISPPERHDRL
jgi:hypothetical protein